MTRQRAGGVAGIGARGWTWRLFGWTADDGLWAVWLGCWLVCEWSRGCGFDSLFGCWMVVAAGGEDGTAVGLEGDLRGMGG